MGHNQKASFRQAIVCREYAKARRLWAEYMGDLRGEIQRGAFTPAQMEEARELFEWARITVLCQRAHIRQSLRGLQVAGIYNQPPDRAERDHSFSGKL
jgi:hypothetical protein